MTATQAPTTPVERAGRREFLGLAVLSLPTLLLALDMSVLYLAVPHLTADLGASGVQQLWITDIYGFMVAGLLITMGNIGDRIGRRQLLLIGGTGFAIASALAAWSQSPEMLIATRALMGVFGATLMPSTLALISNMFKDPKQHGVAIGVWMSCFMGGTALGPLFGGAMLSVFWWGAPFLAAIPVGILLLVAGPKLLPEFTSPHPGRLDVLSVAMSMLAILPVVWGLKEMAKDAGPGTIQIGAVVFGLVMGYLFFRRQNQLESPLLDPSLFRNRTFSSAIAMTVAAGLMAGSQFLIYTYLQLVLDKSPLETALWMLPSSLLAIVSIMGGPLLVQKVRPAYAMAGGLVFTTAGYLIVAQVDQDTGIGLLVTGLCLTTFGIGPAAGLSTGLVMSSVPPEKAGAASSVSETAAEFGIAMGIALMGMLGTLVYRSTYDHDVSGLGLTEEDQAAAREGIAGARDIADGLGDQAAGLIAAAKDAFSGSVSISGWASAALAFGLIVLALTTLRHVPSSAMEPQSEDPSDGGAEGAEATAGTTGTTGTPDDEAAPTGGTGARTPEPASRKR